VKIAFAGSRGIPARYGGFETAVEEIGARLAERGHEVSVYCRKGYDTGAGDVYRGMRRIVVPYVHQQAIETLTHTASAVCHASMRRPDVLLLVNPANGPLLLMPRLARIPCAINVDGLDWERTKWPVLGRRVIEFGAWCCTKLAPVVIADAHGIQTYYRERWGRESYYASYGAEPYTFAKPRYLHEWNLESRGYHLVVARLEPENHTDLLIELHARSASRLPLIIIGDTNYDSAFVRAIKKQADPDRVRFLGALYDWPRLRELLAHANVYLHGHSVGGTNPILLEAMACGACILYLAVVFNEEVAGDAGVAFSTDPEEGAHRLAALESDPARADRLRAAARARQAAAYTWDGAADAYERLCRSLAETGRAPGADR